MYTNAYNQMGANEMALGSNTASLQSNLAQNLASIRSGLAQNLANVGMGAATNIANVRMANAANSPFADLAKIYAYNMGQQNMLTKNPTGTASVPYQPSVDYQSGDYRAGLPSSSSVGQPQSVSMRLNPANQRLGTYGGGNTTLRFN